MIFWVGNFDLYLTSTNMDLGVRVQIVTKGDQYTTFVPLEKKNSNTFA